MSHIKTLKDGNLTKHLKHNIQVEFSIVFYHHNNNKNVQ